MSRRLRKKRVAILVDTAFEEVELTKPRVALHEADAETDIVSPNEVEVRSWNFDDWGDSYNVDVRLKDSDPSRYDALLLPGGVFNPDYLRVNDDALAFVKHFFDTGKPVAAICHAPWTLINVGVVEGRRLTSYKSIKLDLQNAGAHWVDEETVVDNRLLTSRNPDDIPAFNEAMIDLFEGEKVAA